MSSSEAHPTLGMPTQFPELNRASQNLSYWKRKPALDLQGQTSVW